MESHQVTVIITREIVQKAARRFVRRYLLRGSASDLVFIGIGLILGLAGVISRELTIAWIIGGLALLILIYVSALNYVRLARSKFVAMTDPHVNYSLTEKTVSTKSDLGSMEAPWRTITEIWKFDDVWLLFFGSHGYSTFPASLVAPEVALFLEKQVRAHGGKVS